MMVSSRGCTSSRGAIFSTMPPNRTDSTFRVGLVLQTGQAHMRGICRGVFRFLQENDQWEIVGEGQYPLLTWRQLTNWQGDGVIAIANNHQQFQALLKKGLPAVNAGSRILDNRLCNVTCDSQGIGALAAEHLLNCGLRNLLFVGQLKWEDEQLRHKAFVSRVEAAGRKCETLRLEVGEYIASDASAHYRPNLSRLSEALQSVAKPVGICAPNSVLARFVSDVAHKTGFVVPDDVAVLGVNDDPIVCESTKPPLSAVAQPSEQIGVEAAKCLDLLMRGKVKTPPQVLLPPMGTVARRSTDVMAIEDEDVRTAMRYIHDNASQPIEVSDVASNVAVSRRTLETKFKRILGRTPSHELRQARMELAKKLLMDSDQPITKIAFAAGFNSRQVFSNMFRKETGMTASAYRRQFRRHLLG